MPWLPLEFYYPVFALFILGLTLIFVPRQKFAPLFWTSLFWGYFLSIFYILIFSKLLGLFHYIKAAPFTLFGSPIWLNLAWLFSIMLYLRFLPTRQVWYVFPLYLFAFAMTAFALDLIFHQTGLVVYSGWNPIFCFLLTLVWFYGAAKHQWILEEKKIKPWEDEAR